MCRKSLRMKQETGHLDTEIKVRLEPLLDRGEFFPACMRIGALQVPKHNPLSLRHVLRFVCSRKPAKCLGIVVSWIFFRGIFRVCVEGDLEGFAQRRCCTGVPMA